MIKTSGVKNKSGNMENKLEYRMYGLVPYNLSPIQQGIQFGHAVVEYMINYPMGSQHYNKTDNWARRDKTFMILNGGTTNNTFAVGSKGCGTLNVYQHELNKLGVTTATFSEPDLGDQLTAVVFLVDERVWDYENYPNRKPQGDIKEGTQRVIYLEEPYESYCERLGGEQNVKLREFLSQFRLA